MRKNFITDWDSVPIVVDLAYVSSLLGVSNEYARRLVNNGTIKAFKVGKLWRINKTDLKNFVESLCEG